MNFSFTQSARICFSFIVICIVNPCTVHAGVVFGVFGVSVSDASKNAAETIITNQGHTVQALSDLSGTSLTGIDVLWVINAGSNQPTQLTTTYKSAVSSFVTNGGVFLYHDEAVNNAQNALPGVWSSTSTFQYEASANTNNINVGDPTASLVNGPGGSILDSTLDNGIPSNVGYATGALLPNGSTTLLTRSSSFNEAVDFQYAYGNGFVYYSTIPLDYHLAGTTTSFSTIYAPNVVNHVAGVTTTGGSSVPEPASLVLFAAGLSIAGLKRFRRGGR